MFISVRWGKIHRYRYKTDFSFHHPSPHTPKQTDRLRYCHTTKHEINHPRPQPRTPCVIQHAWPSRRTNPYPTPPLP